MRDMVSSTYSAQGTRRAPLITLISASGGVGKSTIALIIGHLAAARGIKTAIVEGDLQFGDMGFWLGLDVKLSSLAQGEGCIPVPISAQLDLFKAPALPEVAEEISDAVARVVENARANYDLIIADTGQFWSGLTGELLCNSELVLLVMDQRRASAYGAIKALELCQRLGIPLARIAHVFNRDRAHRRLARLRRALQARGRQGVGRSPRWREAYRGACRRRSGARARCRTASRQASPPRWRRVLTCRAQKDEAILRMRLGDYIRQSPQPAADGAPGAVSEKTHAHLRELLYREVPSERIAQLLNQGREHARQELAVCIEQILSAHDFAPMSDVDRAVLIERTLDMVLGLGPIEKMLKDDSITEIMVNGPHSVFFERDGIVCKSNEHYDSEEQLRLVIDRIVSPLGRRVDEQCPLVNARLPEGHRVNVVIPPLSMSGSTLTIRKFRKRSFTLDELVGLDALTSEMAQLLAWAIRARKNIAVSGGTGGGKTTLLNALSRLIPHEERVITIEDSAELRFDQHPHVVRLEARLANAEGRGMVTIRDLVTNALRMRPDRIIVGECRGAEALDMLQAMNTGHDGSLTTLHANSPAEVIPRLVMMVRYGMDLPIEIIEEQVASALDLIVQQDRLSGGKRRITQIAMRGKDTGSARKSQRFTPIVHWDRRMQRYDWSGLPAWIEELPFMNVASEEEVAQWVQSVRCC